MADLALATESMLDSLSYLGPLRSHPKRTYQWSGDTPASVGQTGEQTVAAILAAENDGRQLNRGPHKAKRGFAEFVAGWLKDLGVIHDFSVRPVAPGRKEYEVLIKTGSKSSEVKIRNRGTGWRMKAVIDTNVLLVANGDHADVSEDCVSECVRRLQAIQAGGVMVIDDGFRIIREYLNKHRPNAQKGAGNAYLKWLF
jgi:hypothetical protein